MEVIENPEKLQQIIERNSLLIHLQTLNLEFLLLHYQKNEFILSPDQPVHYLLFIAEGLIHIYDISSEGKKSPVTSETGQTLPLLGDIEFSLRSGEPYFVEAVTEVTAVAIPIAASRQVLNQDVLFLQYLTTSLATKLKRAGQIDIEAQSVQERVLIYMENIYPNGILRGVDNTAMQLRCSRRQLQRVLKDLCASGKIKKIGRGTYQLVRKYTS